MYLRYLTHVFVLFSSLTHALPQAPPTAQEYPQLFPRGKARAVNIRMQMAPQGKGTSSKGISEFPTHSTLTIDGNNADGPLKIQISIDDKTGEYYVRHYDGLTASSGKSRPIKEPLRDFYQGTTTMTNDQFLNSNGEGALMEAIKQDPVYRTGAPNANNMNTCHNLVSRIMAQMNIKVSTDAQTQFDNYDARTIDVDKTDTTLEMHNIRVFNPGKGADPRLVKTIQLPDDAFPVKGKGKGKGKVVCRRDGACTTKPTVTEGGDFSPSKNEMAKDPVASLLTDDDLSDTWDDPSPDPAANTKPAPPNTLAGDEKGSTVTLARAGGTLTTFSAVSKEVLGALGVAGTVAGAVFVILDFVGHDWVGAAIGSVGLAVGIAAGFAVSGPVGWVVGGVIAALFAILPGLFKDSHPPADRTDVQGIIQWKMFGDKTHTGNEQCQKGTKDVPGNKDCQALYGPGTLATALGFDNFDAIVFLTQFNDGHPMTIKDMAAAFYVVDDTKPGDGGDKIATIECHNKRAITAGKAGEIGGDSATVCDNPTFQLKRQLIHLPNINDTADKVFDRIIPAPNGDCKLIAYPGDQYFPSYAVTIQGLPSAIACGLTAAINVDGTPVPIAADGSNGQTPELGSSPSQSTDGQGGAYVAPPPQAPFAPLAQTDYVCLVHDNDAPFCLPPGSYHKQSGLGFEIKSVNSLTLPPGGWSLNTTWKVAPEPREPATNNLITHNYAVNQDPTKKSPQLTTYKDDMHALNINTDGAASFTVIGPGDGPDPVCCLFTEAKFGGNVWCVGVGGGDVLPQWKKKANSVSCHNGGNVWLYADNYGDAGGALVKGNVEDLKDEPYGNDKGTFANEVVAIWVLKG